MTKIFYNQFTFRKCAWTPPPPSLATGEHVCIGGSTQYREVSCIQLF